jgi:hypothetical protein
MFNKGQSIKDKNHIKAGVTNERKISRRRLEMRCAYPEIDNCFLSIEIIFSE